MTSSTPPTILMVGPDVTAIGGMATVALALADGTDDGCGYECVVLNSGGGRGPSGWRRYPKALLQSMIRPYDAVHLHVASRGSTWRKATFALVARLRRRPYIIHLHGADYREFLSDLNRPLRWVVERFYRGAASVIALGEGWRDLLIARAGAAPGRTVVIANGVPEITPTAKQQTIVFVGEVSRRKGADVLLAAARRALPQLPDWKLQLIGPLPEDDVAAEALGAAAELGEQLVVVGPRFGDELFPLIASASVFTLPSRNEGLPMAMLEAMSARAAVVVTPVGAIDEVIEDGRNGILVPAGDVDALADALVALATDAGRREQIAAAGRQTWRDEFSAQHMVDAVHQTWAASLAGAG